MLNPNAFTERLLHDAGIAPGMSVLDVGCAGGEVSFLVARMVGNAGRVVGIDRDSNMLDIARARAGKESIQNVSFLQRDLSASLSDMPAFDAIVGRRVMMYVANPVAILTNLASRLKTGGRMIFQESDSTMLPGQVVAMPLHDQVLSWIWKTVEREGANIHMGFQLPALLKQAGMNVEHVRAEAVIQGQGTHLPLHVIMRAMLPRIVSHGVASAEEIDVETLETRLEDERRKANSVYVSDMPFGMWATKP
jgi:ubiquinone/menaquinone biosynthesis C-methylase UbiE